MSPLCTHPLAHMRTPLQRIPFSWGWEVGAQNVFREMLHPPTAVASTAGPRNGGTTRKLATNRPLHVGAPGGGGGAGMTPAWIAV